MIKTTELRIGNLIISPRGKMIEILNGEDIDYVGRDPERYMGVPITPEILEGCGFKFADGYYVRLFASKMPMIKVRVLGDIIDVWYGTEYMPGFYENLHQFQNLYFAIAGEELTVNLPAPVQ